MDVAGITMLVVEPDPAARSALRELLDGAGELRVVVLPDGADPDLVARMLRDGGRSYRVRGIAANAGRTGFGLTGREEQVLGLLCEGLSNAQIAQRLVVTEKTVKNHLYHIFAKLRVRSRTEAVLRWTGR